MKKVSLFIATLAMGVVVMSACGAKTEAPAVEENAAPAQEVVVDSVAAPVDSAVVAQ